MENNYPKPKWWRLYTILPVAVGLLLIDSQLALPSLGHKLVEIGIVLLTSALLGTWVLANAAALEWGDIAADDEARVAARQQAAGLPALIDMAALARERNN
jgi:hypothetical protein